MAMISANFDKAVAEERMLLGARTAQSTSTGRFLIAVDVTGVALILMLAVTLMRQTRRSNRELADSLSATRATNESLEAAVAERTEHLVAANEKLRHSSGDNQPKAPVIQTSTTIRRISAAANAATMTRSTDSIRMTLGFWESRMPSATARSSARAASSAAMVPTASR